MKGNCRRLIRTTKLTPAIFDSWNEWLPQPEYFGRHYLKVILWKSQETMHAHIAADDGTSLFSAMHKPNAWLRHEKTNKRRFRTHISTLHLVQGSWNTEVVAHELLHFIFFVGMVRRDLSQIEQGGEDAMNRYEEPYCYLHGALVDAVSRQLWERNPPWGWEGVLEEKSDHPVADVSQRGAEPKKDFTT